MRKTTLKFINLADLIQFQNAIGMTSFRINASAILLTGHFTEENIRLAKEKYQGQILQSELILQELDY